jgi:putative transposase
MHHRRSIRLPGYDYTQAGVYFVTVVSYGRMCWFGKLDGDEICLSQAGQVAETEWQRLEKRFPGVVVDEFTTIMPKPIHGIIFLPEAREAKVKELSPIAGWEGKDASPTVGARGKGMAPTVGARQKEASMIEMTLFASPLPALPSPQPPSPVPHGPRAGELGTIVGAYKSTTARLINGINHTPGAPFWQRNYYEHIIRSEEDLDRIRVYIQDNPRRWADDKENLRWK